MYVTWDNNVMKKFTLGVEAHMLAAPTELPGSIDYFGYLANCT